MRARPLLSLAWRESRFARRRLFLFLSSISLGVAALVAVQGFAANLERGIRQEARALLGADLVLSSRQPFGPRAEALLDSLRRTGAPVARLTSFASMALLERTGATRLVQVRAPEAGYPFYGRIETRPAGAWASLGRGRNAIVDPALLPALGARVGDSLSLGESRFRIAGVLDRVPGDVELASAFAPRVFIPARAVPATGLVDFGSRVEYEAYVRLASPGVAERVHDLHRTALRRDRVGMDTAAERQGELEEAFGRLTSYLGLVGVLALLLGGIGVASAMSAYMAQKAESVAVLRCLGATAGQLFQVYLIQAAAMGLAGAGLGVALGLGAQWLLPELMSGLLPVEVAVRPDAAALVTGVLVGAWVALVFAALPLLSVRRISPLGALRRRVETLPTAPRDGARWAAGALLGASALLLVYAQVRELRVAAGMVGGVAAALGILWVLGFAAVRAVRRLPRATLPYPARQGLANLHRPGNQTRAVVVALGFGVCLLATLLLTQHNLLLPLRTGSGSERPNLLLWDVQDDQRGSVESLLRERGLPVAQRAPIVPMRVAAIGTREVRPWSDAEEEANEEGPEGGRDGEGGPDGEDARDGWALRREYRSTYRGGVMPAERVVAGEFWEADSADPHQVSLEVDIAGELGVGIGDTLVWDVQGVRVPTVVTSLREVDWARFEPNFFAVFPPAALEGAPRTWVLLSRAESRAARAEVQRDLVLRFPNVAVLDLTRVQQALDEVIGRISAVIRFLGGFSLATGFVVLLGAVATGRLQRVREAVLLRTLGATRSQVGRILLTEYLVLGILAVLVGTALAAGAGWALARWVFEVPFELQVRPLALLGITTAALVAVVGAWAGREAFRHSPMEAIREE